MHKLDEIAKTMINKCVKVKKWENVFIHNYDHESMSSSNRVKFVCQSRFEIR